ncbi:MAG: hypothetical protein ABIH89_08785 [Elusimicrobiota bacterium]
MIDNTTVLFREVQKFNQFWVWLIVGLVLIIAVSLIWAMIFGGLPVEVTGDLVNIKFPPFMSPRKIYADDISSFEARAYNPMKEYGGWGGVYGEGEKTGLTMFPGIAGCSLFLTTVTGYS